MTTHLTYLFSGLGLGAVIAALALGIVVTHRASNVINFAHGAIGTYLAFVYYELRASGDLIQPIIGLPGRVHIVDRPTVGTAMVISMIVAALLGAACYALIFRPLRTAAPLARVVASLGLMTYLIGLLTVRITGIGVATLSLESPLPSELVEFGGIQAPADRYWMTAIVLVLTTVIWALSRFTNFGLATRATAENEAGAILLGISPDRLGYLNWMLATMLAGIAMILAAPIIQLDPSTSSLIVVPALGAALLGRFRAIWLTVITGFAIGMLQLELQNAKADWGWLPDVGLQQGLPFIIVLVALLWRSDNLLGRDTSVTSGLPPAPEPKYTIAATTAIVIVGVIALMLLDSQWRLGIIVSAIAAIVGLSVVVLTGLVGQISLATYALAGIAAFGMVRAADELGLGFPFAPIVGIFVAVAIGTLAGLPAIRVRGLTLAVASLAAAVAMEELVFRWSWFSGGLDGARAESPSLFGVDLGISAVGAGYPRKTFGVLVLATLLGAMVMVVNLRRSATGRQWLAVRANERAAEAIGISGPRVKLTANGVAAFLAGLAGTMTAYQWQLVSADSFGALESLVAVAIGYLAGIAAPAGALIAGVLAAGGILTVLLDQLSDGASDYQFAVSGLFLIIAAVRFPSGILGSGNRVRRSLQKSS